MIFAEVASSASTAPSITTTDRPRRKSGSSGSGGRFSSRKDVVTSSGAAIDHGAQHCRTSRARLASQIIIPAYAVSKSNRSNSSAVTTPKLPPPPRSAQKSSGWLVASARSKVPSAMTISIAVR